MAVYFAEAQSIGLIKIGCTRFIHSRMLTLKHWSPVPLILWAHVPGSFADEKKIHYRLRDSREHGEWFRRGPVLDALIAETAAAGELPVDWRANDAERWDHTRGRKFCPRPDLYPAEREAAA